MFHVCCNSFCNSANKMALTLKFNSKAPYFFQTLSDEELNYMHHQLLQLKDTKGKDEYSGFRRYEDPFSSSGDLIGKIKD